MSQTPSALQLLPRQALLKTGDVDHADWNFKPILGTISRIRFRLVSSLLAGEHFGRLLEIGYGSGVFLPHLARFCDELHGLDVHPHAGKVTETLTRVGVQAHLTTGSAEAMSFPDGFFDCIVAVSALEFIPDLAAACRECRRVLRPGGPFIVVTPGSSPLVDLGLKLLTGQNARDDFGERRQMILPTLREHFQVQRQRIVPRLGHSLVRLYTGLRLSS